MAIIRVGPNRTFKKLSDISPAPSPGDTVVVDPGVYKPSVDADTITWTGTLANPITIKPANPRNLPVWKREIRLQACSYVVIQRIKVFNPTVYSTGLRAPCITINGAGTYNTIESCKTRKGLVGIQLNENCGLGHLLDNNTIFGTLRYESVFIGGNGIAVSPNNYGTDYDRANSCVHIKNNRIINAGAHGMELQGRYGVVENNTVLNAGLLIRGCSGIHVLNDDRLNSNPDDTTVQGHNWLVLKNIVYGTKTSPDSDGNGTIFQQDGNGIQSDHGTNDVTIQGNICVNNDGPGIAIYDGANINVWFNTCRNNSRDSDGNHIHRGEITFGTNENVLPTYLSTIQVWGNACEKLDGAVNNVGFGLVPHVVQLNYNIPISVDSTGITFAYNVFKNSGGNTNAWRLIDNTYTTISAWNAARPDADSGNGADIDTYPGWPGPFDENPKHWEVTYPVSSSVPSLPSGMTTLTDIFGNTIPANNASAGAIQN